MLQPGTYTLTIDDVINGENASASGDLDITDALTIKGKGAQDTRIDGNKLHRVFDIRVGTATEVHIEGVTITGGDTFYSGSGIRIEHSGALTIANSIITANVAGGGGGGVFKTAGTLRIIGSSITANTAAEGGGIYNQSGTVTLTRTTFKDNKPDDCRDCQ